MMTPEEMAEFRRECRAKLAKLGPPPEWYIDELAAWFTSMALHRARSATENDRAASSRSSRHKRIRKSGTRVVPPGSGRRT